MNSGDQYDVIIIGSGAGGGTLAYALAGTGKRILLLERGGFLPREKDNWNSHAVFVDQKYKAKETWHDSHGKSFHPSIHYNVGGNTKVYGAALLRFRTEDFGELRHHGGISPAWPIGYDELEPYYTKAEALYSVHGEHGIDPTGPPVSAPLPHPPISHEPRIQELFEDFTRLGCRPFPLPMGIRLNEQQRQLSPCIRCETCDGFPCLVDAKADAEVTCVRPALGHPNVRLIPNACVTRLQTSSSGREVTRVVAEVDGREQQFSGSIVVVSCGAINSAALLLRSTSDKHPDGLGNRSGVVGRYYMCHNNSALLAISRRENPTRFQKTLGLNDFYLRADDFDYPLGHIAMLGKSDAEALRSGAPAFAPGFALDQLARHALDFWITSEDLPDPENRVSLDRQGKIHLTYTDNNLEPHRKLIMRLKGMLRELGCHDDLFSQSVYFGKKIPLAGVAHQCGTVRFGRDPHTSALDTTCKAHDLDNLYVVDASFFVSSTAVNPALTIIANALRVADCITGRLR